MLKTKYERMKPYEKKKIRDLYKKTQKGKEMLKRLIRLNLIGLALILYALYFFIKDFSHLSWTNYFICIPIFSIGLFFIVMAYRLRIKALNYFTIKNK